MISLLARGVRTQLRRLGRSIKSGDDSSAGGPTYADVMGYYDSIAVAVLTVLAAQDWEPLLLERDPPRITSRAKTIDTLREKLLRRPTHPLYNIQDLAGVRFEAHMTLREQDAVASAVCASLGGKPEDINDLRVSPQSGYRGVHVRLELPQGRVEVQVRTLLQGMWANAYEAAADIWGREIRYGGIPSDPLAAQLITQLQELSTDQLSSLEEQIARCQDRGIAKTQDLITAERAFLSAMPGIEMRLRQLTPEE